jgi:hypothetical protein
MHLHKDMPGVTAGHPNYLVRTLIPHVINSTEKSKLDPLSQMQAGKQAKLKLIKVD